MAYRKSTLRSMSPTARKVARLIGEQESIAKRLKNIIPEIQRLELDSRALVTAKQTGIVLTGFQRQTMSQLCDRLIHSHQLVLGSEECDLLRCITSQL